MSSAEFKSRETIGGFIEGCGKSQLWGLEKSYSRGLVIWRNKVQRSKFMRCARMNEFVHKEGVV